MPIRAEHRFSVKDYQRMAESNVFRSDARVELLAGRIIDRSLTGPFHRGLVKRLSRTFPLQANGRWLGSTQDQLRRC